MGAVDSRLIRRLNLLYRICVAGEKGFGAVAGNVSNRGLKILLKGYAQQRAQFANELKGEIQRLGGNVSDKGSIRGIIHRGRIHLVATFIIGEQNIENFVLNEARRGEETVVRTYKRVLEQDLPADTRAMLDRQYQAIQETLDRVNLLRGQAGQRLVVRLFDSEQRADAALQALERAGFTSDRIEIVDVQQVTSVHEGERKIVTETVISGALGGAIWGSIIAAIAGISALTTLGDALILTGKMGSSWAVIALSGTFLGAFIAAILGLFVGIGVSEEDTYRYDDGLKQGTKLIRLNTDIERAPEAAQIMYQINASAR